MPRHTPSLSPLPRKARSAVRLTVAASALSMLAFWGAYAQQATSLRGPIPVQADDGQAQAAADDGTAIDSAEPQQPDDGSVFDDPIDNGDNAFGGDVFGDPEELPARTPSPRRNRAAAPAGPATPAGAVPPANGRGTRGSPAAAADAQAANPDDPAEGRRTLRERADTTPGADPDTAGEDAGRTQPAQTVDALPRGDALETNPYDAVGIRAGGFILRPSVETGITASSNAARTASGSPGTLSETTLRLSARSDWSENTASLDGFGTFRRSLSGKDDVRDVEGGINAALTLDLGQDWQARTGLSYTVEPESGLVSGGEEQSTNQRLRLEAGLDKEVGKLRLGGTVSLERDWYGEAETTGGTTADESGRDSTLGLLTLRTGYEVSPAVTPFVEAEIGRRIYDEADTRALRLGARAGVALDLRDKLSGEISAGYLRESFEDSDGEPIQGPTLNAALRWSPVRDTVVALNASTTVEGAANAGDLGSVVQDLRLDVERTLRANLTAEAGLGASLRDYSGSDRQQVTWIADLGATWWLNRWFGLSGRLRHERLESNVPGTEYKENSVFVGTRLQY